MTRRPQPSAMSQAVPNPATPRQLRPVHLITDRAKRYRATQNPPEGPKACAFCSKGGRLDVDHIDGDEANGNRRNLMYLCRSCNVRKGIVQAKAGEGKRTQQYNPQQPPTFRRYVDAVRTLRGDRPGDVAKAAKVMQGTPPAIRAGFVDRIRAARNPQPSTPTFQQYAYAVAIHQRGSHDEGGKIIHATPPAIRSKYAKQFSRGRRSQVPF